MCINLTLENQSAVERATGLSREVLRKWEQRYQFPVPVRGARGQRLYAPQDVEKLQCLQRLTQLGQRPGQLVRLPLAQLQALLAAQTAPPDWDNAACQAAVQALLAHLTPGAPPQAVATYLAALIEQYGLRFFVAQQLPTFNQAIGAAWAQGQLSIHAEHHYTETVRHLVLRALPPLPEPRLPPRVLLTTPPGELHSLGLLALQAGLALQGADCINLGTQTPAPDVLQAVAEFKVQVVAISLSACLAPAAVNAYAQALSQGLPADCHLWLGGQGSAALASGPGARWTLMHSTAQAVAVWVALASVNTTFSH